MALGEFRLVMADIASKDVNYDRAHFHSVLALILSLKGVRLSFLHQYQYVRADDPLAPPPPAAPGIIRGQPPVFVPFDTGRIVAR